MTARLAMRPLEERHVADDIELMVWSTKMDLLALSYANGEVALHRLNWLKVWTLPPPHENVKVNGIAWRPDGKVIAIGYSNKQLLLVSIENKDVLIKNTFSGNITLVSWSLEKTSTDKSSRYEYDAASSIFLPRLPTLSRGPKEEHKDDAKGINDQKDLNILFVGLSTGQLIVALFGVYPKIAINIQNMLNCEACTILDAGVTNEQDTLFVSVLVGSLLYSMLIKTPILSKRDAELKTVALKYGQIYSCLDYLDLTLQSISEGWEDIMMEMESKLRNYASRVSFGRVSSDFLDLFVSGKPSSEMHHFLVDDLTEKGIKKLNHSVEISYANTHGFVLKNLPAVGHNIAFHIDTLCGLSRCPVYRQIMGLLEEDALTAFGATGSFLVKVTEVQRVITESVTKFKAFFRWLLATYLRLSERTAYGGKMSQQQYQHVVEFITNMEKNGKFNLDKLGQYLIDGDLEDPINEPNLWEAFLNSQPALRSSSLIVPRHNSYSLIKQIRYLKENIASMFDRMEQFLISHFQLETMTYTKLSTDLNINVPPRISHTYVPDEQKFLLAIFDQLQPNGYHFVQMCTNTAIIKHQYIEHSHKLIDVQFYLPDTLSLLLRVTETSDHGEQRCCTGFEQLPVRSIIKDGTSSSSGATLRLIDGMLPERFAVCGARKVAVVLADTKRRVKIFEMDVEDEDEEEEDAMDTTNTNSLNATS